MQDFRKLRVWQKAHEQVLAVYRSTRVFPKHETYGLRAQLRRAAASIPANIAEGCGRGSDADFSRFLIFALSSACELEYHLILARDLDYLTKTVQLELEKNVVAVKRMIGGLLKRTRTLRYTRTASRKSVVRRSRR
jgi:four helix bundle protein